MDPEAHAVESSAHIYLTASENRDYAALWHLMSRGAQALVVATVEA
jgi:hypothetical protein